MIAKARAERDRVLLFALERYVRPVRFEPGQIEIALTEEAEPALPQKLMQALKAWTGERWMVAVSKEAAGSATAHEVRKRSESSLLDEARADPLVQRVLQRFPGAEIVSVRERSIDAAAEPDAPATAAYDPEDESGGDQDV